MTRIDFSIFNHLYFNRISRLLRLLNRYIMFIKFDKNVFNLILFERIEGIDIRTFKIVRVAQEIYLLLSVEISFLKIYCPSI